MNAYSIAEGKKQVSVCFMLLLTVAPERIVAQSGKANQTPASIVEHLVQDPHGLTWLAEEDQRLLDDVLNDPQTYREAIAGILGLPSDLDVLVSEPHRVQRIQNGLILAQRIGPQHAGDLVRTFYKQTRNRAKQFADQRGPAERLELVNRQLDSLQNQSLKILGQFKDSVFVDDVVAAVSLVQSPIRSVMLTYLLEVAPLRPDIRPKLEEMYNSETSPLRNNPQLERVLDAIDATKNNGQPDEDEPDQQDQEEKDE